MDSHIRTLTVHDICARAKAAADLGIPHDEANHFKPDCDHEGHIHAAFKGAYESYSQPHNAKAAA